MAEVLPPPMQPSSTITMLHSRPASADAFHGSQQQYGPSSRVGQTPRGMYNSHNHGYRGTSAPVQPYAFQSTPTLRHDSRTSSASAPNTANGAASNHKANVSTSTTSSDTSSQPSAKEDSSTSLPLLNFSSPLPDLSLTPFDVPVKASPDRYRRPAQKRLDSGSSNAIPKANAPQLRSSGPSIAEVTTQSQQPGTLQRQVSLDDVAVIKAGQPELAKRYRRRSLNNLESQNLANPPALQTESDTVEKPSGSGATSTPTTIVPIPTEEDGEAGQESSQQTTTSPLVTAPRTEGKVIVPPTTSSSDGTKRLVAPVAPPRQSSNVANEAASSTAPPPKPKTYAEAAAMSPSPAAQQLAAVSDKDLNKGMKSRLRRAFSFGSAQELRKAAGQNHQAAALQAQQAREQHQQQEDDELDAEQLEIARRQEAAGIGAGIYSGQGGFTGSTDNLSISSTASSASLMLRKMGRGAKKGARSIRGLFRPKSVIGVPAADGPVQVGSASPVEPSVGQVSMVTVEAERLNVNVNAHADERIGGTTSFPKLERNSIDAARGGFVLPDTRTSAEGSDSHSRRSIVGSDRDRAEVLAAVKKGILKRSHTGSPSGSPIVMPTENGLIQVPQNSDSPISSLPSTPKEPPPGRSSSAPNVNNDYFATRLTMARTMPNTPNGSVRSISFSPKIQFHDVWSSTEYDRRGEIATCNRLTPMLAQQIKEELNTFKMEMEVHELSKPHTHFF